MSTRLRSYLCPFDLQSEFLQFKYMDGAPRATLFNHRIVDDPTVHICFRIHQSEYNFLNEFGSMANAFVSVVNRSWINHTLVLLFASKRKKYIISWIMEISFSYPFTFRTRAFLSVFLFFALLSAEKTYAVSCATTSACVYKYDTYNTGMNHKCSCGTSTGSAYLESCGHVRGVRDKSVEPFCLDRMMDAL